jgi:hypothetical protein
MDKIDAFTKQYIETALWSSTYEKNGNEDVPMDRDFTIDDIYPECLQRMINDCEAFQESERKNGYSTIEKDLEQAGHDFWLTRNGHGAGFWDGDWGDEEGKRLTEVSHTYGEYWLYVSDDGMVHVG